MAGCTGPVASPEPPGAQATIAALSTELQAVRATATAAAARPAPVTPLAGSPAAPPPSTPTTGLPSPGATPILPKVDPTAQSKAAAGTAERVLRALRDSGLAVGETRTFSAENDPDNLLGRPGGYLAKAAFRDTRLVAQTPAEFTVLDGGTVEVWPSEEAARRRREALARAAEAEPERVEYSAVKGPVLLRLSRRLTPDQATAYQTALTRLGSG